MDEGNQAQMGKLTARKVETAKPGKYGDGGGLQFWVATLALVNGCYATSGRASPISRGLPCQR